MMRECQRYTFGVLAYWFTEGEETWLDSDLRICLQGCLKIHAHVIVLRQKGLVIYFICPPMNCFISRVENIIKKGKNI